jgi:hypothetical protein
MREVWSSQVRREGKIVLMYVREGGQKVGPGSAVPLASNLANIPAPMTNMWLVGMRGGANELTLFDHQ